MKEAFQLAALCVCVATVLVVAGIGALCTLGGQLCRDAGEKGMGEKVELGGKIMMLSMALPMAASLLQAVCEMLL